MKSQFVPNTGRKEEESKQKGMGNKHKESYVGMDPQFRKPAGFQKSMGHKCPWKIGMLICHPVTSRPPHVPAERVSFVTL